MPATFDTLPYVYGVNRRYWRNFLARGQNGILRIGLIGDSRLTTPGGAGHTLVACLARAFAVKMGTGLTPETPLITNGSFDDMFISGGNLNTPTSIASYPASNQIPPGLGNPWQYTNGSLGHASVVQWDNNIFARGFQNGKYFDASTGVTAEIFAATQSGSGEVAWAFKPRVTGDTGYFGTQTQSGTTTMGLDSATPAILSEVTPSLVLPAGDGPYPNLVCRGSTGANTTILGVRFRSRNSPNGIAVQPLAAGGYHASSFLANHSDCGDFLVALGMDAYYISFGANDAATETASQFKTNVLALIAQLRTWHSNPALPIILSAAPWASGLTVGQQAEFDQFAGSLYEIAQSDSYCLFVNTYRQTSEHGWNAATEDVAFTHTTDGVHPSADGAALHGLGNVMLIAGLPALPSETTGGHWYAVQDSVSVAAAGITSSSFASGAIDAAAIAANAIGASELAADAASEIATAVADKDVSAYTGTTTLGGLLRAFLRLFQARKS